jgi:uncharacterized damage-inducible protein DinB
MSPQEMQLLFEYNAWANRRALTGAEKLTSEQFTRPMASSFSSVRDTLAHICGAEWVWLERFQGRSPSALPSTSQFQSLPNLREHWLQQEQVLLTFVRGLKQSDLDRELEYKTLKFGIYRNPLSQSMLHVVNHGTYHRGQVTTLLRQHGAEPLLMDLMHFYRERSLAKGA